MAKTKSAGTVKTGRDSKPKYLGVKLFGGQKVKMSDIIIRQKGTKYIPGKNVKVGRDNTIYAAKDGVVKFSTKRKTCFNGKQKRVSVVSVV